MSAARESSVRRVLCLIVVLFGLGSCLYGQTPAPAPAGNQPSTEARLKLNVFTVVSGNLERLIIQAATALSQEENLSAFPLQGFQIHATLYMTMYGAENLDRVKAVAASLAAELKAFPVRTTGLAVTKDSWLFVNLERTRPLQELSDQLVKALSPFRLPNQKIPEWVKNYPEKLEFFQNYGSPNVFSQFEPHFTLLAKSDSVPVERFFANHQGKSPFGLPQEGKVIGIGIGEADGAGQMKKPLAVYLFP